MIRLVCAVLFLAGVTTGSPLRAASFDCTRARLPVERMICADALLSGLDEQLYAAFMAAGGPASPQVGYSQSRWVAQRNRCASPSCVSELYRSRIAELKAGSPTDSPAHSVAPNDQQFIAAPTGPRAIPSPSLPASQPKPAAIPPARAGNPATASTKEELKQLKSYPTGQSTLESRTSPAPDRIVWTGRYKCGWNAIESHFVVMGTPTAPKAAYFISDQDKAVTTNVMFVYPIVLQYNAKYDEVLDGLKLSDSKYLVQGSNVSPPREFDLSFDEKQSVVRGRLTPSCEFALQRQSYPASFITLLNKIRANASVEPPVKLDRTNDSSEFCLVLSAWMQRVRMGATGRDLTKPIATDPASRLFLTSVFHESMTGIYLGRDLRAMDRMNKDDREAGARWRQQTEACLMHPLFFEDGSIFKNVFYYMFNNMDNLKEDLNRIPAIQAKIDRIAQSRDRFSEDSAGLAALNEYVTPLQAELAPALTEVRDSVLRPLRQRQVQIATAILRDEAAQPGQARSLGRLEELEFTAGILRANGTLATGSVSVLARGEALIASNLETLLVAEHRSVENLPQTVDGLLRLKTWRSQTAQKFSKLGGYQPYKDVMASTDERLAKLRGDIVQDLPQTIAQESNTQAISAIRSALETIEGNGDEERGRSPLWAAYNRGLGNWFDAQNQHASDASAVATSASQEGSTNPLGRFAELAPAPASEAASIFTSPSLHNSKIVSSIYRRDFTALKDSRGRVYDTVVWMLETIGPSCPGVVPAGVARALIKHELGPGAFGTRDEFAAAGAKVLMDELTGLAAAVQNPGRFQERVIQNAEAQGQAQGDAQVILSSVPCNDPSLKTFIANFQAFLINPSEGVSNADATIEDLCVRSLQKGDSSAAPYCECAFPILNRRLSQAQVTYVRNNPKENFWPAISIIPNLETELRKCQQ